MRDGQNMFKAYNAHPKRLVVGDCVVRAITVAKQIGLLRMSKRIEPV